MEPALQIQMPSLVFFVFPVVLAPCTDPALLSTSFPQRCQPPPRRPVASPNQLSFFISTTSAPVPPAQVVPTLLATVPPLAYAGMVQYQTFLSCRQSYLARLA